jgi:hypothetical protein
MPPATARRREGQTGPSKNVEGASQSGVCPVPEPRLMGDEFSQWDRDQIDYTSRQGSRVPRKSARLHQNVVSGGLILALGALGEMLS